jgi:hypothetical protein
MTLEMAANEKILLHRYLRNASTYFEFGCGGSTIFACTLFPSLVIHTVDSSEEWIEMVKKDSCFSNALSKGRANVTWINLGRVGGVGSPATKDRIEHWSDYSESIKARGHEIDFVLVDGRFRVAAFLRSILHTNRTKVTLGVHDFFIRPEYYPALEYADIVDCVDNLAIFKPKANIDEKKLKSDIHRYIHDFKRL